MDVTDAVKTRRSVKKFMDRPVRREEIEALIEAAVTAPNHHLTEPWEFVVLGPESRRAYGTVLGKRKAKKVEDPGAAELVAQKIADEHAQLPGLIAVTVKVDDNVETREEDYAATFMAIENLCLRAVELGLGTHLKTGAVMDDPAARAVLQVADGRRIVALINIGEPAEEPAGKPRTPAMEKTRWLA
jgi:nitroreductase